MTKSRLENAPTEKRRSGSLEASPLVRRFAMRIVAAVGLDGRRSALNKPNVRRISKFRRVHPCGGEGGTLFKVQKHPLEYAKEMSVRIQLLTSSRAHRRSYSERLKPPPDVSEPQWWGGIMRAATADRDALGRFIQREIAVDSAEPVKETTAPW
jgi:hypothetical protein